MTHFLDNIKCLSLTSDSYLFLVLTYSKSLIRQLSALSNKIVDEQCLDLLKKVLTSSANLEIKYCLVHLLLLRLVHTLGDIKRILDWE